MPALNDTEKDLIREMNRRLQASSGMSVTGYTASDMTETLILGSDDDKRALLVIYLNEIRVPEATARVQSLASEHGDAQMLLTDLTNYLAG